MNEQDYETEVKYKIDAKQRKDCNNGCSDFMKIQHNPSEYGELKCDNIKCQRDVPDQDKIIQC